jgi:hypothetical protein
MRQLMSRLRECFSEDGSSIFVSVERSAVKGFREGFQERMRSLAMRMLPQMMLRRG